MAAPSKIVKNIIERITQYNAVEQLRQLLSPKRPSDQPLPPRLPTSTDFTEQAHAERIRTLADQGICLDRILPSCGDPSSAELAGNIENFIGYAKLPMAVIGPLRINGSEANGDFYVPMATSEGALAASYHRGANLISHCGGATVMCLTESVSRAPCFAFNNLRETAEFMAWLMPQVESLQEIVRRTSRFCQLLDVRPTIMGKDLYLNFEFTTGDAAGQNMVTIATDAICHDLAERSPVKPQRWYIDGNLSGDKKATMNSFLYTRGKKVVAEVIIPKRLVRRFLHVAPQDIMNFWEVTFVGGSHSGAIGAQGHYANALAALFIACGQDAACVAEAAVGITRMDITNEGDLYVCVSLPNLIVGTVGGGTQLPTANEALAMLGCCEAGTARKFAEICAATVLAGEISITGAIAAGDFTKAHQLFRPKQR